MEIGVLLQGIVVALTAASLVGAIVGFFLKGIKAAIKDLTKEVENNGREIAVVREMVSGHDKRIDNLEKRVDKLEDDTKIIFGNVIEVKTRVDNCPNCNL